MADRRLLCAFCDGSMESRTAVDNVEGETGGAWNRVTFECTTCGGSIARDVFEKIGHTRERWSIERIPSTATRYTTLHCPACQGPLVCAKPIEVPAWPTTNFFADRPARSVRETEHACLQCDVRYRLAEDVSITWRGPDGATISSPLPYRRDR